MSSFRLQIEDGKFVDNNGCQVILRGINVAGDAKYPSTPDLPSHYSSAFFDGDNVNFHKRPFPKDEAHVHFARLKRYGYNTIRYVFTWEAIEAAGPGIYDEEWVNHTVDILRIAKSFGFYVFMDPHQDVWSRYCGGSGAPLWTLYLAGFNPEAFVATEAAIVQNTYDKPESFPKMIWSTNYYRLAAATMFTLFFGGRDFAPKCIVDGMNIQDYLQKHFFNACGYLAKRIKEAGDIQNEVVFGWESMNEPNRGMIGIQDITVIPKEQALKKGTSPTLWQAMLTGSGRACEVDTWDMGGLGPYKIGKTLIDPQGESAWLPKDYDESRYNYKRDAGWELGTCLWAQHGVWNPALDELLKKDYFSTDPKNGKVMDYEYFTNNYFMDYYRGYKDMARKYHEDSIMLLQGPTMEVPPTIKGTPDDEQNMVYAPHFYDGITLMTKKWNRTWNVDVVGILRGRYLTPAFGIKFGESAIRNCFRDQLAALRKEGLDNVGNHPCILTEFGIPFDMDNKHAYKTGDYSSQSAAMDANHFGVEGSRMEGYTLWMYMTQNDHEWGDQWNGEDLSIFSVDDTPLAHSAIPLSAEPSQSTLSLVKPGTSHSRNETSSDTTVVPANLAQSLASPSISSDIPNKQPVAGSTSGYRAAEAFVRPAPITVAGDITHYTFDLKNCTFVMNITAHKEPNEAHPTTIFLPEYHIPKHTCTVETSSGKWEICSEDDGDGVLVQRLRWWHGSGEQHIRISAPAKRHNVIEGVNDEAGYYESLNNWLGGGCAIM